MSNHKFSYKIMSATVDLLMKCSCTFLSFLFLVAAIGCEPRPHRVEFVLPDGFRGGFALEVDPENGQSLPDEKGVYTIRIAKNGIGKVKRVDFLGSYLSAARFENGVNLWVEKNAADVPPKDAVCLFGGVSQVKDYGAKNERVRYWWFAGNSKEHEEWRRNDPELGRVAP